MANLFIPVILGTVRQERMSEPVANFVVKQVSQLTDVETELIDIRVLPLPLDNAGPGAKIPAVAELMQRADGFIIVTPEYNHGYPGLLKHFLDLHYAEYVHKAVGVCSVSSGSFAGVRAVEALLSSFKAFGLSPIVPDFNIGDVEKVMDETGQFKDPATYERRSERFLQELVWMTKTLKHGRENFELS